MNILLKERLEVEYKMYKLYNLQRISSTDDSTFSVLSSPDHKHLCFIIEDEHRDEKVNGETRIPSGTYSIKKREVLSPLTKKYRSKYNWFDYHLELQDVPEFEYVYIHVGNFEKNTDGCLLTNLGVSNVSGDWVGSSSVAAFEVVYKEISDILNNGDDVSIRIEDEDYYHMPF